MIDSASVGSLEERSDVPGPKTNATGALRGFDRGHVSPQYRFFAMKGRPAVVALHLLHRAGTLWTVERCRDDRVVIGGKGASRGWIITMTTYRVDA